MNNGDIEKEEKFLNKKTVRLNNLLDTLKDKNKSKEEQNNSDSEDGNSDKELQKYKSLISGKLNLKNISKTPTEGDWTPGQHLNKKGNKQVDTRIKNPKTEAERLFNMLPMPKKKLMDNQMYRVSNFIMLAWCYQALRSRIQS
jgi:hypothetical protein